jgi:hypothetical protein
VSDRSSIHQFPRGGEAVVKIRINNNAECKVLTASYKRRQDSRAQSSRSHFGLCESRALCLNAWRRSRDGVDRIHDRLTRAALATGT